MKVELQLSFLNMAFFRYIPSSKIAGSDGGCIVHVFFFKEPPLTVLVKNHLVKNPPGMREIPGLDPWIRKIPWRRGRLPIPVFWPGEFHGLYSPWGLKESDTAEQLSLSQ